MNIKVITSNRKLSIIGRTLFTAFAFMFELIIDDKSPLLSQLARRYEFEDPVWCMLLFSLLGFYYLCEEDKARKANLESVFATIFSVFMLFGKSYLLYNSWDLIFDSVIQTALAICAGIGWWFFFCEVLKLCVKFCTKKCELEINNTGCVWFYFGIIILGWLPFAVLYFPGSVPHDGMYQLSMWFGYDKASNHHPWFTTVIFGILMSIGKHISDNTGIFFIVLFQILVCAGSYSFVCLKLQKWAGYKAGFITSLFFSIIPMWGMYSVAVVKDTLFFAIFALYFCSFIDVFELKEKHVLKKTEIFYWGQFIVLNIIVCLIRNDGIYRVILAGIALFLAASGKRKKIVVSMLMICGVLLAYNTFIYDVVGVQKGSPREMLSIPLQQTARYVRDCDDITEKEKNSIAAIMPYDSIEKNYNEEISDPIKNRTYAYTREQITNYASAWVNMGLRHPDIYIQATLNNTFGYFYPFYNSRVMSTYQNYIKGEPVNKGFDIYYIMDDKYRNALSDYSEIWRIIPGVALLSNPGMYTWLMLIGIMILLKKRMWRELAVASVLVVQVAICIASPVNGLLRYAMPLMGCMPVFGVWIISRCRDKDVE